MTDDIDFAPVRVVVFDLGGVVLDIDFDRAFTAWANKAAVSPAELARRFETDLRFPDHDLGKISDADYFASLRGSLQIDLDHADFLAGWLDICQDIRPGMRGTLVEAAMRYPLYGFSNANPTHYEQWSQRHAAVLAVFERLFVSCELGYRKPDRRAFDVVLQSIGEPPDSVLFFDDRLDNVLAARTCGMQAVHVQSVRTVPDVVSRLLSGPDHTESEEDPSRGSY